MVDKTGTDSCFFDTFVHLQRNDPVQNMHRFYRIHVTPGIFDDWLLVREWGRIGSPGMVRKECYPTRETTVNASQSIVRKKLKKGYTVMCFD